MLPEKTNQPYSQNKVYRNFSNIAFNDHSTNQVRESNPVASYRTYSQIGNLLQDGYSQQLASKNNQNMNRYHQYTYQNRIAQKQHGKVYLVPQKDDPQFQRINKNYAKMINHKSKFTKPYSECTKFVDNLMKNKELLRRGQFDLPVQNQAVSKYLSKCSAANRTKYTQNSIKHHTKTQKTEFVRSRANRKKDYESIDAIKKKMLKTTDQKNGFDKTVDHCFNSYREMLQAERKGKKDENSMKNSMNRILAAEMINYRLATANPNNMIRTRSMRLDKTQ